MVCPLHFVTFVEVFAMQKLVLLYWGTILLMYLSQVYYPVESEFRGLHCGRNHFIRKSSDLFMLLAIFWICSFSFLRTAYNDTWGYAKNFRGAETAAAFIAKGGLKDITGNPFSSLYRNFLRQFTDNIHIYFFFPAFLSTYSVIKLCKKYSVNPAFSLLIFFSIGTYLLLMAALKQCFAFFFLSIALPYAIDKKYVRFFLLVFIAILFHTHAFMFAIIPFLFEKPWGKTTWLLFALVIFAMTTYDSTLGAFMQYAQSLGANVYEGEVFDGHSINVLRVLVYWIPTVIALIFRRQLFSDSTRTENLFVNMTIVSSFILMIGLVQAANLFARMAGYFEIAMAISLPWMIRKLFTKQSEKLITSCAVVLYFIYFWYENAINRGFEYDYAAITCWQFIRELIAR